MSYHILKTSLKKRGLPLVQNEDMYSLTLTPKTWNDWTWKTQIFHYVLGSHSILISFYPKHYIRTIYAIFISVFHSLLT
jgi:hypothetical protein